MYKYHVHKYIDIVVLLHVFNVFRLTPSPVVKESVVVAVGPIKFSKQWSLYTTTLSTHWVRVGRVVML